MPSKVLSVFLANFTLTLFIHTSALSAHDHVKLSFVMVRVEDQIVYSCCFYSSENTDEQCQIFVYYFIFAIAKLTPWKLKLFMKRGRRRSFSDVTRSCHADDFE